QLRVFDIANHTHNGEPRTLIALRVGEPALLPDRVTPAAILAHQGFVYDCDQLGIRSIAGVELASFYKRNLKERKEAGRHRVRAHIVRPVPGLRRLALYLNLLIPSGIGR